MSELPSGYSVIERGKDYIIIGMYNFLLMLQDADPYITYKGVTYKRGMLEAIPSHLIGNICSMRRYNKSKD